MRMLLGFLILLLGFLCLFVIGARVQTTFNGEVAQRAQDTVTAMLAAVMEPALEIGQVLSRGTSLDQQSIQRILWPHLFDAVASYQTLHTSVAVGFADGKFYECTHTFYFVFVKNVCQLSKFWFDDAAAELMIFSTTKTHRKPTGR